MMPFCHWLSLDSLAFNLFQMKSFLSRGFLNLLVKKFPDLVSLTQDDSEGCQFTEKLQSHKVLVLLKVTFLLSP